MRSAHRILAPLISLAAGLMSPAALAAEEGDSPHAATAEQAPPRLVLAISVDQFSGDLFAQYRSHFTGGFTRLMAGAVFPQGYQSHAATETCTGHSTLLTGARPSRTGIIANDWYDVKLGREVYCAEDPRDPASSVRRPVVSPVHLKVPTLGDLMKRADSAALNVAVSAKDRSAVMMTGHDADAVYWWVNDGFVTYQGRGVAPAARAVNAQVRRAVQAGAEALPVPAWCGNVDRAVPVKDFTIGTYRFPLQAGDYRAFSRSPRIDAAVGDLAVRLVDEMGLGRDAVTDVLSVSFSATDYVGHAYGTQGVEMCIQLAQLDAALGRLFAALDQRGIDYVAVLTADHGGIDAPERLRLQGFPAAQRVDPHRSDEAMAPKLAKDLGIAEAAGPIFVRSGVSGDIWLSPKLTKGQRRKVQDALVERLSAHPQVAGVYRAEDIAKLPVPQGAPQTGR